ncbi:MAG: hypothetical protein C0403_08630 [Desulfobacterium sp.]|nr:hypothetical protein [Desulfobacterium sp.]
MFHNKRFTIIISCLLIFTAITSVALFGIVGYGRSNILKERIRIDTKFFYLAGKTWLEGFNPYDASTACKMVDGVCSIYSYSFAYPPSSAIFVMSLALLDLKYAQLAVIIVNILCLILFVYINLRILSASIGNQRFITDIRISLLIAMVIGNVAVANTLWMGQTGIIISTVLIMSYYFYFQSNDIISGLFLSLALLKPQLSYPFFLWLLLEKKWKILTVSLVGTFFFCIVPFSVRGISRTFSEWIKGLGYYLSDPANQMGNFTLSAARQLLNDLGFHSYASLIAILISLILIISIHKYCKNINMINLLGILSIIGLLFGQAHHYDLVIAAVILPFFLSKVSVTDYRSLFLLIALFVIFNLPRVAFLLKFDYWVLNSHREIILLGALLLMVRKYEKANE